MNACDLLHGHPWKSDRQVIHHGPDNVYLVVKDGVHFGLKPLPPKLKLMPKATEGASKPHENVVREFM